MGLRELCSRGNSQHLGRFSNLIIDNPTIGYERDFVRIGEIKPEETDLKNMVEICPGHQYLVYVYFHNNASSEYNDSKHNNVGVALRARMSIAFTEEITPDNPGNVIATLSAENSDPLSVYDTAIMTTSECSVRLRYVQGSAKIYNDWDTNGQVMPSALFDDEGTLIGLNELNGVIPGCEEYHGVVTFVLQAE